MLSMPEADVIVVKAFRDCGISNNNGMGESPISWTEILAYSQCSGSSLSTWERKMVRSMSESYLSYKSMSTKYRGYQTPYKPTITEQDAIKQAAGLMKII